MKKIPQKVIYQKPSSHGHGSIPAGTLGKVIIYAENPVTTKLLADFFPYGKAVVPLSSIKILEE